MKNCMIDPSAYLDILIKAKVDPTSVPSSSPSGRMHSSGRDAAKSMQGLRLPTIAERESESDLKEELDRKERDYQKKIAKLQSEVDTLRHARDQVLQSHSEMKLKMIKKGGGDMLLDRQSTIASLTA